MIFASVNKSGGELSLDGDQSAIVKIFIYKDGKKQRLALEQAF